MLIRLFCTSKTGPYRSNVSGRFITSLMDPGVSLRIKTVQIDKLTQAAARASTLRGVFHPSTTLVPSSQIPAAVRQEKGEHVPLYFWDTIKESRSRCSSSPKRRQDPHYLADDPPDRSCRPVIITPTSLPPAIEKREKINKISFQVFPSAEYRAQAETRRFPQHTPRVRYRKPPAKSHLPSFSCPYFFSKRWQRSKRPEKALNVMRNRKRSRSQNRWTYPTTHRGHQTSTQVCL